VAKLRIEVRKKDRKLSLFDGEAWVRELDVAFGFAPAGSKEIEGDGKTPEGEYFVAVKNPESRFHLSLGLNYPNVGDATRGLESGLITGVEHDAIVKAIQKGQMPPQNTALGGEIYIHGGGVEGDWTRGCIGLADDEMAELFNVIPLGTMVSILP
jgi:murein L,D-transpeptidase YafK